jgi:hypothetical protein
MKYLCLLAVVVLLPLTYALSAYADEPAKYNFASAQGNKEIRVVPSGEGTGSIYFYNIDGNRITHIVLEIIQSPAGWQIEIQPPLGETQVDINGQVVTVSENLYIEPSGLFNEEAGDTPEGMVCISVPDRGYALAREAKIIIKVPASEPVGSRGEVILSATAQWLGQNGAVAIKQNRDFNFSVEVVAEAAGFKEKVLDSEDNGGKWLPAIFGAGGFILLVSIITLYIRRRRD